MKLRIITPKKVAHEQEISSITLPSSLGEITILPKHIALFSMLSEGVVRIQHDKDESFFSIGGGYIETDGKDVNLLVSRAYGQDEIDEAEVSKAREKAEKLLETTENEADRQQAMAVLRRSMVDMKLLKKIKRRRKAPITS